jgi:hypothetical protein
MIFSTSAAPGEARDVLAERTELTAVVKSAFAGAAAQEILTRSTLDRANFRLCFEPRRATSATAAATVRFSIT